jgi:hypothetical protein
MKHAAKYTYDVEEVPVLVVEMYEFMKTQTKGPHRIDVTYDYQKQRHTVAVFTSDK